MALWMIGQAEGGCRVAVEGGGEHGWVHNPVPPRRIAARALGAGRHRRSAGPGEADAIGRGSCCGESRLDAIPLHEVKPPALPEWLSSLSYENMGYGVIIR
mgnify:CR=1 FL=1